MGNVSKIIGEVKLGSGFDREKGSWNLPFSVELGESVHIHWQDIRIEMDTQDFEEFVYSLNKANEAWIKDGKPKTSLSAKFYGKWKGEEQYNHFSIKDRKKTHTENGKLRHHFRVFPRTQHGKKYYDNKVVIELQQGGQYHIHYKNFRIELGSKQFKQIAKIFKRVLNE